MGGLLLFCPHYIYNYNYIYIIPIKINLPQPSKTFHIGIASFEVLLQRCHQLSPWLAAISHGRHHGIPLLYGTITSLEPWARRGKARENVGQIVGKWGKWWKNGDSAGNIGMKQPQNHHFLWENMDVSSSFCWRFNDFPCENCTFSDRLKWVVWGEFAATFKTVLYNWKIARNKMQNSSWCPLLRCIFGGMIRLADEPTGKSIQKISST